MLYFHLNHLSRVPNLWPLYFVLGTVPEARSGDVLSRMFLLQLQVWLLLRVLVPAPPGPVLRLHWLWGEAHGDPRGGGCSVQGQTDRGRLDGMSSLRVQLSAERTVRTLWQEHPQECGRGAWRPNQTVESQVADKGDVEVWICAVVGEICESCLEVVRVWKWM